MSPLDNRAILKQLDPGNYFTHILDIPQQLVDGFELGQSVTVPALYAQAKQVVILAGTECLPVAEAAVLMATNYTRVPLVVQSDYTLPHWVSSDTLVIALDYYGTTDQVVVAYQEAAKRKVRLLSLSVGGDIARESRRFRAPHVTLSYGAPARMAFYYMLACLTSVLDKLDLLDLRETTVLEASVLCRSLLQNIGPDVPQYQNSAKQLAEKIMNRKCLIVGSGPLVALAQKWQMTLASTGKMVVTASTLSQFNDTIVNALRSPGRQPEFPLVIMLQSKYDYPRNKLQQTLTYQVAQSRKWLYEQIFMHPSGSLFGEMVLCGLLGDLVSYYGAILNGVDPSEQEASQYIRDHLANEPVTE